jgi:hypothetical protein
VGAKLGGAVSLESVAALIKVLQKREPSEVRAKRGGPVRLEVVAT